MTNIWWHGTSLLNAATPATVIEIQYTFDNMPTSSAKGRGPGQMEQHSMFIDHENMMIIDCDIVITVDQV